MTGGDPRGSTRVDGTRGRGKCQMALRRAAGWIGAENTSGVGFSGGVIGRETRYRVHVRAMRGPGMDKEPREGVRGWCTEEAWTRRGARYRMCRRCAGAILASLSSMGFSGSGLDLVLACCEESQVHERGRGRFAHPWDGLTGLDGLVCRC